MKQLKRILPFVLIMMAVFGLLHYLIFMTIVRSIPDASFQNALTLVFWVGWFSIPCSLFASRSPNPFIRNLSWLGFTWMGVFFILFSLTLVELVLSITTNHSHSEWILFAAVPLCLWSLIQGLRLPEVTVHELKSSRLAGKTLVQLSDLHIGLLHLNRNWLKKVLDKVKNLNPDILVITGDMVEGDIAHISEDVDTFAEVKNIPHKFFITGNHEYIHGGTIWEKKMRELGFRVLHNSNEIIEFGSAKLLMAGVPDIMVKRFQADAISQPDLALKNSSHTDYKILLAHQPASAHALKTETCDLVLTGHTHGGQIFPFHFLVRLSQPVVSGFKMINNVLVFAHNGTGFWGPPMRLLAPSQVVLFKWK